MSYLLYVGVKDTMETAAREVLCLKCPVQDYSSYKVSLFVSVAATLQLSKPGRVSVLSEMIRIHV